MCSYIKGFFTSENVIQIIKIIEYLFINYKNKRISVYKLQKLENIYLNITKLKRISVYKLAETQMGL